jgi:hypothetical protein
MHYLLGKALLESCMSHHNCDPNLNSFFFSIKLYSPHGKSPLVIQLLNSSRILISIINAYYLIPSNITWFLSTKNEGHREKSKIVEHQPQYHKISSEVAKK